MPTLIKHVSVPSDVLVSLCVFAITGIKNKNGLHKQNNFLFCNRNFWYFFFDEPKLSIYKSLVLEFDLHSVIRQYE